MLPSTPSEFRSPTFWRSFFRERGGVPFEWYADLSDILPDFSFAVPITSPSPRLLVPGCGNSKLSEDLWRAGYMDIVSCDFDAGVVEEMRSKSAIPGLVWETADATALAEVRFPTDSFTAVLDKGLLDALLPHGDDAIDKGLVDATAYLGQAARVLTRSSGTLAIVTLAQTHVLEMLLRDAVATGAWRSIDVLPAKAGASPLCPFLLILRRSAAESVCASAESIVRASAESVRAPAAATAAAATALVVTVRGLSALAPPSVLSLDGSTSAIDAVLTAVGDVQMAYTLRRTLLTVTGHTYVALDLWLADGGTLIVAPHGTCADVLGIGNQETPAYSLVVLDAATDKVVVPKTSTLKKEPRAAVLLVPAGREHEWAFGAPEGQRSLAASASVDRLIVVTLGTGAVQVARFRGMCPADVQAELSPIVLTMVPAAAAAGVIPYLSVAADLGERTIVAEGNTPLSGRYFVEDVADDEGSFLRRLIFFSNRAALQTEVSMRAGKPDPLAALSFSYHRAIARAVEAVGAALAAKTAAPCRLGLLVIGLGGGALPTSLASTSTWSAVTAVELDAGIVNVAEHFFACPVAPVASRINVSSSGIAGETEEREAKAAAALGADLVRTLPAAGTVGIVIGDGLRVIQLLAHSACTVTARPTVLVIDVNAGASELVSGLSFPPPAFLTPIFLTKARAAITSGGALIVNLGARSAARRAEAMSAIASAFPPGHTATILPSKDDEDRELNCVVIAGEVVARADMLRKIGATIV